MHRQMWLGSLFTLIVVGALLGGAFAASAATPAPIPTLAPGGGGYDLSLGRVGGGGASSGGGFALTGLVGQPEAGQVQGGGYTVGGGFYGGSPLSALNRHFFAPYVVKRW